MVAHRHVFVYDGRHVINQTDDLFGHPITRRGFTTKNNGARRDAFFTAAYAVVQCDDVQDIEQLAFVFVYALNLHIKQTVYIEFNAGLLLYLIGQTLFIGQLHFSKGLAEIGIIGQRRDFFDLREVFFEAGAYGFFDQSG